MTGYCRKKIFSDVLLNVISSGIPLVVLQLLLMPQVSRLISANEYGRLVSSYSLMAMVGSVFGSSLNNLRLIRNSEYPSTQLARGDFNRLLILSSVLLCLLVGAGLVLFVKGTPINYVIIIIAASLLYAWMFYTSVELRLELNYVGLFWGNVGLGLGYVIGYAIFRLFNNWAFIYLSGYGVSFIYLYIKSKPSGLAVHTTSQYNETRKRFLLILASAALVSMGVYVDKLIIYPVLGGAAVAVYYVASLIPKMMAMIVEPAAGVLLSYLAHMQDISKKTIERIVLMLLGGGIAAYFIVRVVSMPILRLLYPQFFKAASALVSITTATGVITVICSFLNAIMLKFRPIKWQLIINTAHIVMYLLGSMILMSSYHITGMCMSMLIGGVVKIAMMITILIAP